MTDTAEMGPNPVPMDEHEPAVAAAVQQIRAENLEFRMVPIP